MQMADEAGILRSAAQSRVQLYIPYETAHDTVKALGEVGLFQPEDLSEDAKHSQGGRSSCREILIDDPYTRYWSMLSPSNRPRHYTFQQDIHRAAEDAG